jgi:hypothetical protein
MDQLADDSKRATHEQRVLRLNAFSFSRIDRFVPAIFRLEKSYLATEKISSFWEANSCIEKQPLGGPYLPPPLSLPHKGFFLPINKDIPEKTTRSQPIRTTTTHPTAINPESSMADSKPARMSANRSALPRQYCARKQNVAVPLLHEAVR